jgi:hypothetical protein
MYPNQLFLQQTSERATHLLKLEAEECFVLYLIAKCHPACLADEHTTINQIT